MEETAKDFINKFHNLQGVTVKARQHNAFELFRHYQSFIYENPGALELIETNLQPKTHLEKIFRIDFLIYFRCFHYLYQDYTGGDEITLKKLAKKDWFFQEACKGLEANKFVNQVLPSLPFNVRLKILRRLQTDEQHTDEIFEAVKNKFGLFQATICLPKCSPQKIENILKTHLIKLTPRQLKLIYDKAPTLIYLYVEERKKHEGSTSFMDNNPAFTYIAKKNPAMFSKLFNKYKFSIKLGRRTTRSYVVYEKDEVIEHAKSYIKILKLESLIRKLGTPMKQLLFQPHEDTNELHWTSLISYYPRNQQFNIYKTEYDKVYQHTFSANVDEVSDKEFKLITNPLLREELAIRKLAKGNDKNLLKYTRPSYCFNELFENLSNTISSDRAKNVQIVTESCVLSNDTQTFLKLCKLVSGRFKNDDPNIRMNLLSEIGTNLKFLEKLEAEHWDILKEILASVDRWFLNESIIKGMLVKYLMKTGRPVKDLISKRTDWLDDTIYRFQVWKDPTIIKEILCQAIEVGFQKQKDDELSSRPEVLDCILAHVCEMYNRKNPKNAIDISTSTRILGSVKQVLETETSDWIDDRWRAGIANVISRKNTKDLRELKQLYFKSFKKFGKISPCYWFLKHEPQTLLDNFNNFLANFPGVWGVNTKQLWRLIKKYSHLGLDKVAVDHCKMKLAEEGFPQKKELVKALSILSDSNVHLGFIQSYKPESGKVDMTDDDTKEFYLLQCELVKSIHYADKPDILLPVLLDFCVGDYLKSALGPLYSLMYKLPNDQAMKCLTKLQDNKAVSVKKHAMHLKCIICDQENIDHCLKTAPVPSLLVALKYFVKNPSENLWQSVETKISKSLKEDLGLLRHATNITVPLNYMSRYIEAAWNVSEKYEDNETKKILIKKFHQEVIATLSPHLGCRIIESTLFKIEEANDLAANLLIHSSGREKFSFLAKILGHLKTTLWIQKNERRAAHKKLHSFICKLFVVYASLKDVDKTFVTQLESIFKAVFDATDGLEDFILISSLKLKGESRENCAKLLLELHCNLVKKYGRVVTHWLAEVLRNQVLPELFKNDGEIIDLCSCLMKLKKSVDDYLLIIKLLPTNEPKYVQHVKLYDEMLNEIEQETDDSVRISFNLYLASP